MKVRHFANNSALSPFHETSIGGSQRQRGYLARRCLPLLACVVLAAATSCVVIPTPEHGLLAGRGKIDESDIAFLQVGKTTRQEVLLRFGEPDAVLNDQSILTYHWQVSHGYWMLAGGYTAAGGPVPKNYLLMLEFDEEDRLKRFERSGSILRPPQARLDKWTSLGGEKSLSKSREIIVIDPIPEARSKPGTLGTSIRPVRFQVGKFRHLGADPNMGALIGHSKAAFGVIIADVVTCRPALDMVRTAVTAQLEAAGYRIVARDADVTVTGEVAEFGVTTSINILTWDAIGYLDVILELQPAAGTGTRITRRYRAKHVARTLVGPSQTHFEEVMRSCLEDMQIQILSDQDFARLLEEGVRP